MAARPQTSLWIRLGAPIALAALLAAAAALAQRNVGAHDAAVAEEQRAMRTELDRAVLAVRERHDRTLRRTREAFVDPRPEARSAVLRQVGPHYAEEMARLMDGLAAARRDALEQIDPQVREIWQRQVDDLREQAARVSSTLGLFEDDTLWDDPDTSTAVIAELNRADRAMHAALLRVEGTSRQLPTWWSRRHEHPSPPWGTLALTFALGAVVSLAWGAARLRGVIVFLRHLARGATPSPSSAEERAALDAWQQEREQRERDERDVGALRRELERANQSVRRLEQEHALSQLYQDNLVNSLRSAVVVTDSAREIIAFNRAARHRFGFAEATVGTPVAHSALYAAVLARQSDLEGALGRAMTSSSALRLDAVSYAPGDGSPCLLDVVITPYRDESGSARGLLWLCDDVTETVHTKNQLLLAERLAAVGRLSTQVAHEIRNPLSAIGLNAELLEDELAAQLPEPARTEAKTTLSAIASEIERLTEITESYLQLARVPEPTRRPTDVNGVVADLCTMLAEELRTHGVSVHAHYADPPPHVLADAGQLRQALLNILRNSRESMSGAGALHITTREEDERVSIAVEDTGAGVPPHALPRIFEPFYTTKQEGTGLGLSLTEQIVREHGGAIRAESPVNPSGGTRVTIDLPKNFKRTPNQHTSKDS